MKKEIRGNKSKLSVGDVAVRAKPQFKHDCTRCHFLGRKLVTPRDAPDARYDLYFCTGAAIPTVIARYGDKGPEYMSGLHENMVDPVLILAAVRALRAFAAGDIKP